MFSFLLSALLITSPPDSTHNDVDYATVVYFTRYDLRQVTKDSVTDVKQTSKTSRIAMDTLHLKPGKYKFPQYLLGRNVCTLESGKYYTAEVAQTRGGCITFSKFEVLSPKKERKVLTDPLFNEELTKHSINEGHYTQTDTSQAVIAYFIDVRLVGVRYDAATRKTERLNRNLYLMDTITVEPGLHKFRRILPHRYSRIEAGTVTLMRSRPAGYPRIYNCPIPLNLVQLTEYLNNPDFVKELKKLNIDVKQLMKRITTEDVY